MQPIYRYRGCKSLPSFGLESLFSTLLLRLLLKKLYTTLLMISFVTHLIKLCFRVCFGERYTHRTLSKY